jgi:hypothetical protein
MDQAVFHPHRTNTAALVSDGGGQAVVVVAAARLD